MKTNQLLISLVAVLCLLMGNAVMANDGLIDQPVMQVNVNTADAEAIAEALVGVGKTRAEAIVAYREQFGKFYAAEELTAVKGIGQATIDRNQDRILVD